MNYLGNDASLDATGIIRGDLSFTGCGNKNVAWFTKQLFDVCILIWLSTGKALDRSMFQFVFFQILGIDTFRIDDSRVPFQDTDTPGPVSSEISSGMQTDITETLMSERYFSTHGCLFSYLDNKGFSSQTR